jgi:predicted ATPase
MRYSTFLGELAQALGSSGEIARALATINKALDQSQNHEEGWCIAELLRIKGEILLKDTGVNAATLAEEHFHHSLDRACQQEALSWELRTAMSLARLWRSQGRHSNARDLLASVYGRFTEGFGTADLLAAQQLLNELAQDASRRD